MQFLGGWAGYLGLSPLQKSRGSDRSETPIATCLQVGVLTGQFDYYCIQGMLQ